jgi:hypothetical protein
MQVISFVCLMRSFHSFLNIGIKFENDQGRALENYDVSLTSDLFILLHLFRFSFSMLSTLLQFSRIPFPLQVYFISLLDGEISQISFVRSKYLP